MTTNSEEQLPPIAEDSPEARPEYPIKGIPTIDFYCKTYARSCGDNDQKAIRIFKEYENQDRVRKLRAELSGVTQSKVSPILLERILGKIRPVKSQSWEKWAQMMIASLNSAR